MKIIRAFFRLIIFFWATLYYLLELVVRENVYEKSFDRRAHQKMRWSIAMANLLGIEVTREGEIPPKGVLLAPNHRSYIDIVPVNMFVPGVYLAKYEVSKWPLIGHGARYADTLWIKREDKSSRKDIRRKVAQALKEGRNVVVHPEGTTIKAPEMNPYRPGIFESLAAEKLKVVPVAIEFKFGPDAWVGDDKFIPHFLSCFGKKKTPVRIHFGPIIEDEDSEALRKKVESWVREELVKMREIMDWQAKYPM